MNAKNPDFKVGLKKYADFRIYAFVCVKNVSKEKISQNNNVQSRYLTTRK
jgi:hypothetical protein